MSGSHVSNAWEGKKQRGRASHESKDQKSRKHPNCIRRSTPGGTFERRFNLLQYQDDEESRSTTLKCQRTLRGVMTDCSRTNVKQEDIEESGHSCYSRLHCETPVGGALLQVRAWSRVNPAMKLGQWRQCLMNNAKAGWVPSGHGAIWCHRRGISSTERIAMGTC